MDKKHVVHTLSGMLFVHGGNFWAVDTSGNYYAEVTQIYKTNTTCSLICRPLILMHVGMNGDISDTTRKGTMRRIKGILCEGI